MKGPTPFDDTCSGIDAQLSLGDGAANPLVRTDGAFTRSVPLPAGADVDDVKATYEKGIIAISVPVPNGESAVKRIEVKAAD